MSQTENLSSNDPIVFGHTQGLDVQASDVASPTLRANGAGLAVAFQPGQMVRLGADMSGEVSPTLRAEAHGGDNAPHVLIIDGRRTGDVRVNEGVVHTLEARMGTGGNNVPMIAETEVFQNSSFGTFESGVIAGTLRSNIEQSQYVVSGEQLESFDEYNLETDLTVHHTLRSHGRDGTGIIIPATDDAFGLQGTMINRQDHNGPSGSGVSKPGEPMYTLTSTDVHAVATPQMMVRRLTPVECERLMGWPDDHTLHRADGRTNADSTRYKMCGNGVASPVAEWIGRNLLEKGF
jgi:C-5 cytosine-specific DNA methylase